MCGTWWKKRADRSTRKSVFVSVRVCVCVCASESEREEQCYWEHFVLRAPMWNSLRLYLGARANLRSAQCSDSCITAYFSHSGCNVECDWLSLSKAKRTVIQKSWTHCLRQEAFNFLHFHIFVSFIDVRKFFLQEMDFICCTIQVKWALKAQSIIQKK